MAPVKITVERVVAEAYIGGGKLRWVPVPRHVGLSPWDEQELKRKVCESPRALMALSKILTMKEK